MLAPAPTRLRAWTFIVSGDCPAIRSRRYSANLLDLILFITCLSQSAFTGNSGLFDLFIRSSITRFLSGARFDYASMEFWLGTPVLIGFSCEGRWPERSKMVALGPGGDCQDRSTQMVARRTKRITPDESGQQTIDAICLKGEDYGITSHIKN